MKKSNKNWQTPLTDILQIKCDIQINISIVSHWGKSLRHYGICTVTSHNKNTNSRAWKDFGQFD